MNINIIIKKLFKSDIKDFDVMNINVEQIKDQLLQRQDLLFNTILIVLAIIVSVSVFSKQKSSARGLQAQIAEMEEKIAVIREFKASQTQLQGYFSSLERGQSAEQIIQMTSNLAPTHNVQITSFSPAQKEDKQIYTRTNVKMNLAAQSYEDLGHFIAAIEDSEKSLRVRRWVGRMEQKSSRMASEAGNEKQSILTEITIESTTFKK